MHSECPHCGPAQAIPFLEHACKVSSQVLSLFLRNDGRNHAMIIAELLVRVIAAI